ncbi:MAG: DSD1 family PLP-dependent enzyme [Candidatus Helarchaeota archaeon]
MHEPWKRTLSTPALVVDYNILQRNIQYMAHFANEAGVKLRPHVKTHKCPRIAKMQLKAGAQGICVAKVSEAEVFAASGITNILIANEIISPEKIERLLKLQDSARTMVCVDSPKNIIDLNTITRKHNVQLFLYIDLNIGLNRTGVLPGAPALELAKQIEQASHLTLQGLQAYEGHLTYIKDFAQKEARTKACMKSAVDTKILIEDHGIHCPELSVGGSGTFMISGRYSGVTEIQPGTYVFNDHHIHAVVPDLEVAATILATVNNIPAKGIITLDMGSKSISNDMGDPQFKGYGRKLKVMALTEEHCQCTHGPKLEFNLGDKLEAIPAHICPTVNLYDFLYVVQDGELVDRWEITARGMRE